jgi:Superoxide dismutase
MNNHFNTNYTTYKFALAPLPYDYSDLEPFIDTETVREHHDVHAASYVSGLNDALAALPKFQRIPLDALQTTAMTSRLPRDAAADIVINSGGVYCHNLFFAMMQPYESEIEKLFITEPDTESSRLVRSSFGSLTAFFQQIKSLALSVYGSGWVWLLAEGQRRGSPKLHIAATENHTIPDLRRFVPLTCLDMWEHAYYHRYGANKSDYVDGWCKLINWEKMDARLRENKVQMRQTH